MLSGFFHITNLVGTKQSYSLHMHPIGTDMRHYVCDLHSQFVSDSNGIHHLCFMSSVDQLKPLTLITLGISFF